MQRGRLDRLRAWRLSASDRTPLAFWAGFASDPALNRRLG